MSRTARALSSLLLLTALCASGGFPASALAASPTATTEAATAVSYEQATLKGTVNPEGSTTSYWFEYGETEAYGTKIPVSAESVGSGTSNVLVSQTPTGLSQSTEYHFRVVAENEAEETAKGKDAAFTTAGFNFSFAEEGSGNGQLKQPNLGIAADSEGNIWVADTENNRVEKFNSKGEYLTQFGKEGSGNGEFKAPKGFTIDASGNLWVVDSGNDRVQKFNSKGEFLGKFGEKGSGEGKFNSPAGVTFSEGNFFVVDTGNNRIQKFNSSFKFVAQTGKEGTGNGEFKSPTEVAVQSGGIWVTDTANNRIQKFNAITLNYAFKFGEKGTGAGQLSNPTGIATPAAQKLLILDTGNSRAEGWTVKAEPPNVIARPAEDLKAGSATLRANINPEALATSYWFEYGTTVAYGTKIPITPESIGSGSSVVKVGQAVAGLSEGTTYHFRAVAESAAGTVEGEDRTVKLVPPRAITEAATAVEATQATLNGKVDPESSATSYWFEYGTTTAYGTKLPITPESVGSGTIGVAVSQTPTGLSKGTTYHFRVVAKNEVNTANGEDKTFTTSP